MVYVIEGEIGFVMGLHYEGSMWPNTSRRIVDHCYKLLSLTRKRKLNFIEKILKFNLVDKKFHLKILVDINISSNPSMNI